MTTIHARRLVVLMSLVALLVATWLVYRPGLTGPYLFDDFANLPALGATGPIVDGPSFTRYITSGTADPTGRPVALASFLLDARDWPAPPERFKRTNVLIHLANGCLLFWLLCCLGRRGLERATQLPELVAAWLGAGMWMLHPLFVSTTLYIVQREAMLPATFALLGLLGWWHGRRAVGAGRYWTGSFFAAGTVVLCTTLAALSKANGILVAPLVLVLEYALLNNRGWASCAPLSGAGRRAYRWIVLMPCWLLSIGIGLYLAWFVARSLQVDIAAVRPWTLGQRLLTEPRILWDYARLMFFPRPYTAGVFNDQIEPSSGFIDPWYTLPAIIGALALVGAAALWRQRQPALSAAILFFACGHAIESTSIPLELYFEHRNYLPALLAFWPFARWAAGAGIQTHSRHRVLRLVAGLGFLTLLGAFTLMNARIWGDARNQAVLWAELNPNSDRAQASAAMTEMSNGSPERAERRLRPLLARHPDQVQIAFNLVAARCAQGAVSEDDMAAAAHAIRITRDPGSLLLTWFDRATEIANSGSCAGFDTVSLRHLLDAGRENDLLPPGRKQDLYFLEGKLRLDAGDGPGAADAFDQALALDPRLSAALEQAAQLGSNGYPGLGLRHLALFDKLAPKASAPAAGMPYIHAWVLRRQGYWEHERSQLVSTLRRDAANQTGSEH
ncbi:hypothetical protein [Luteibacter sp. 329MFSha]|uniref:tetratricopeptide repeat protein n=1 Tax=Luteibacter sp. 329MFSha TaxID=1798239 RepID=UPI0008D201B0|nr:hypothetical protein [Luteibacter sp. 329MFSha]SEW01775.1 hypothetical protein SAMN04515660_1820 [Luteibacter sp. 329MFSha]